MLSVRLSIGCSSFQCGLRLRIKQGGPMRNYLVQRAILAVTSAVLTIAWFGAPEFCLRVSAQVVGATVTGTMLDPSGSAIVNGRVSLHNTDTGTSTNETTNANGIYTAPNLQPGTYDITFSAKGFGDKDLRAVTLTVGDTQVINASMKIGTMKE